LFIFKYPFNTFLPCHSLNVAKPLCYLLFIVEIMSRGLNILAISSLARVFHSLFRPCVLYKTFLSHVGGASLSLVRDHNAVP
jgi:hypothetical protein